MSLTTNIYQGKRAIIQFSIVCFGLMLLLSGCSSTRADPFSKMREVFDTEIYTDDSKRFSYMFISRVRGVNLSGNSERSQDSRGERRAQGSRGESQGQGRQRIDPEALKKALVGRLEAKLAQTGFCREGYMELGYSILTTQAEITGECHESASNEDKTRWSVSSSE